jgi:hypothetical protein
VVEEIRDLTAETRREEKERQENLTAKDAKGTKEE